MFAVAIDSINLILMSISNSYLCGCTQFAVRHSSSVLMFVSSFVSMNL